MTGFSGSPVGTAGEKIALLLHGFSGGGMERSMLRLAAGLHTRGYAVEFVVKWRRGELADQIPEGIPVHEVGVEDAPIIPKPKTKIGKLIRRARKVQRILPLQTQLVRGDPEHWRLFLTSQLRSVRSLDRLQYVPRLARYLRRERPAAVLAAEPHYNAMAVLARRLAGMPTRIVLSERIQPSMRERRYGPWRHPYLKDFLRKTYLSADAIVAVSDGVADDLARCSGIPRERIATIYNPVVGPDITAMAAEPVDQLFFAAGAPPVILAVGRLDPQKDYATLVRAFALVRRGRPACLVILGAEHHVRPLYRKEITSLAAELGVGDDLILPGYVNNPFAYMARAAAFVLSSTHEGLPGVLIQALACGCPAVSTDCPSGPREILEDGRYGPLVPVGDHVAMAEAIEQTLDKPIKSKTLRARADRFSIDRALDSYLQLLLPPASETVEANPSGARRGGEVKLEA